MADAGFSPPLPQPAVDPDLDDGEEEKYNSPVEDSDAEEEEAEQDVEEEEEEEGEDPQQHSQPMPAVDAPVVQRYCGDLWGDGSVVHRAVRTIAESRDAAQVVQEIDNLVVQLTKFRRQIEEKAQLPKEEKWVKMVSSSGKIFYYSAKDRITQWHKPPELMSEEERAAAQPPPPGDAAGVLFKVSLPAAMGHITLSGNKPENSSIGRMKLTLAQKLFRQARAKVKSSKAAQGASATVGAPEAQVQEPSLQLLRGIVKKWHLRLAGSEESLDDNMSAHQLVVKSKESGFAGKLLALDLLVPGAKKKRKPAPANPQAANLARSDVETGSLAMLTALFQ